MKIEDFNFAGKKAIVRVDFNVPLDENGNVTDDTRIRGALPTLKKVLADGGALIMMSHMGKPKGKVNMKLSLSQIVPNVSAALGVEVKFAKDCGNASEEAAALKPGEALLLENLRFYPARLEEWRYHRGRGTGAYRPDDYEASYRSFPPYS
jgi:phosphoglycerate kinase